MTRGVQFLLAALLVVLLPVAAYAVGGLGSTDDPPRPRQDIVVDDSATTGPGEPTASTDPAARERGERAERADRREQRGERQQQRLRQERQERRDSVRVVTPVPAPVDDDEARGDAGDDDGEDRDDNGGDDGDDGGDDDGDDD